MEWSRGSRVFSPRTGEPLDASNVRRDFKAIVSEAGRKQLRPVTTKGTEAMDDVFAGDQKGKAAARRGRWSGLANFLRPPVWLPNASKPLSRSRERASDQRRGGGI